MKKKKSVKDCKYLKVRRCLKTGTYCNLSGNVSLKDCSTLKGKK